jgi:hypothetical protein
MGILVLVLAYLHYIIYVFLLASDHLETAGSTTAMIAAMFGLPIIGVQLAQCKL